jgi:hypothetical protein
MKIKTTLTMLSAIIALAVTAVSAFSQNGGSTAAAPDAPTGFSTFSMPQNLGATVNSADNDGSAVVAPNGLSLYFSSNRPGGQGNGDIWVSQRPTLTSAWGAPQNLGTIINTSSLENQSHLSLDGKTMFFNSNKPGGVGAQDIYISTRTDTNNDFGWTAPVNLTVINSTASEIGAGYFEDPTTGIATLYFASNRTGGLGDLDIYQSTRNPDGTFNAPTFVTELNSVEQDSYPKVRRDGLEIFFHSQRDGGLGDVDIWTSTRASTNSPWNPPVNVTSLNTDDFDGTPSLSPDGSILYFASTRDGGSGGLDIYTATRVSVNRSSTADFDGDGRTDLSVFRPSDGTWYVMQSGSNTFRAQPFGTNGDRIVPGDYDGDGRTDFAVFRAVSTGGIWYVLRSSNNSVSAVQWGLNTDKPTPGDFDGDGKTDIAVYRNGTWYIVQSSNGQFATHQFGASSDIPVAAANVQ